VLELKESNFRKMLGFGGEPQGTSFSLLASCSKVPAHNRNATIIMKYS